MSFEVDLISLNLKSCLIRKKPAMDLSNVIILSLYFQTTQHF